MLTVVSWKWKSDPKARAQFTAQHVNILHAMLKRNLTLPFRHVCVTDDAAGLNPEIAYHPISENKFLEINPKHPNSYRRLFIYSKEARDVLGERVLSLDLDTIILSNIDSLVDRPEDFVAWNKGGTPYQGAIILHSPGTRTFLWDEFIANPQKCRQMGRARLYCGSDQAWVSARLGPGEAVWKPKDGIYSYKVHVRNKGLPANAKIILCHGTPKPWQMKDDFVQRHWRE